MKPTKQTVYLPVKVEDELPAESCKCGIIKNGEFDLSYFIKAPSYKVFDHVKSGLSHNQAGITHWLKPQEAFVFTPEQLNEYTTNVIKQALETAAKKADLTILKKSQYSKKARWKKVSKKEAEDEVDIFSYEIQYKPSKKSITNTFEETFEKFKV